MPVVHNNSFANAFHGLSSGNGRFVLMTVFILVLPLPLFAIEYLFGISGSGLSLLDRSGPGQVTLYAVALLMIVGFSRFVADDRPFMYLYYYARNWRIALRGFLFMAGITSLIVIAGYAAMIAVGKVTISQEVVDNFSFKLARRTFTAMFIAIILAFTEEVLFRAFLMRYLRWNTSLAVTIAAIVFSSVVFAVVHNLADPFAWFTPHMMMLFLGLFLLGVLLSVTYILTGSLMCSVGIHSGLLFSEVTRFKTGILTINTDTWWIGVSNDVRLAPIVWLLFVLITIAVIVYRDKLYAAFALERPVVSTGDLRFPWLQPHAAAPHPKA